MRPCCMLVCTPADWGTAQYGTVFWATFMRLSILPHDLLKYRSKITFIGMLLMLCTGSLITLLLFALLASMGRCFAVPASSIRAYDIPLTVAAWWRACPRCWDTIPSACGTHLRVAPCVPSLLGACLLRHWPHPVDPLMPALYALAQQPALCEVPAQLRDGEAISAFLDDTFRCLPCRAVSTCPC